MASAVGASQPAREQVHRRVPVDGGVFGELHGARVVVAGVDELVEPEQDDLLPLVQTQARRRLLERLPTRLAPGLEHQRQSWQRVEPKRHRTSAILRPQRMQRPFT